MFQRLQQILIAGLPALGVAAATSLILFLLGYAVARRKGAEGFVGKRYRWQIVMLVIGAIGLVAFVIALPIEDGTRVQLLTLLGLVLSAIITLSSTTFVANVFASLMLRSINNFRIGDFITVGSHFGRVCERTLLHTEIQTEDRTLTTLPNLYLVTHPVTVIRTSGTVVSATVSLSYDIPLAKVEDALIQAAERAELKEPFVQIVELGNFAVTYRAAGFLAPIRHLIVARSALKRQMLACLHSAGVEIVSPVFESQRHLSAKERILPTEDEADMIITDSVAGAEKLMFDKAEEAQERDLLEKEQEELLDNIRELEAALAKTDKLEDRVQIMRRIVTLRTREQAIAEAIKCSDMLGGSP